MVCSMRKNSEIYGKSHFKSWSVEKMAKKHHFRIFVWSHVWSYIYLSEGYSATVAMVVMLNSDYFAICYMDTMVYEKCFVIKCMKLNFYTKNFYYLLIKYGNDGYEDDVYVMKKNYFSYCLINMNVKLLNFFKTIFWLILPVIYACLKG